ncbi:MAG: hypothetical protein PHY05_07735 [Methanothrix sp.]|jgi:hypothetical protein|nr:hypothetical protein [Methanothrix sp.]
MIRRKTFWLKTKEKGSLTGLREGQSFSLMSSPSALVQEVLSHNDH